MLPAIAADFYVLGKVFIEPQVPILKSRYSQKISSIKPQKIFVYRCQQTAATFLRNDSPRATRRYGRTTDGPKMNTISMTRWHCSLPRYIVVGSSVTDVTCFNCHYRVLLKLPSPKTCAKQAQSNHKCVCVCVFGAKNRLPSTAWPKCTMQWNKLSIPPATCTCGQHADFDFANSVRRVCVCVVAIEQM